MPRFRKKPVEIEAVRYAGEAEQPELRAFLSDCHGWQVGMTGIEIPTLEGTMTAKPGDWIIRGVQGEFYPCKPDIFEATYDQVDGERGLLGKAEALVLLDRLAYSDDDHDVIRAMGLLRDAVGLNASLPGGKNEANIR